MRSINAATIVIFSLFLVAPIASLATVGYSRLAQNPPRWSQFDIISFVAGPKTYRQQIVKAVLVGTPVGMTSISAKSTIDYWGFGFVSTDQVISGSGGWLFYRPDFGEGWCDYERIRRAIDIFSTIQDIAWGAGIDVYLSVSPDKSTAAIDQLGARAKALALSSCKAAGADLWRKYAEATQVEIVDHLRALAFQGEDTPTYLKTDTHWNELGKIRALRQLARSVMSVDPGDPDPRVAVSRVRGGDLQRMLRIELRELENTYDEYINNEFKNEFDLETVKTLIIHDSFYASAEKEIGMMFPSHRKIHFNALRTNLSFALAESPTRVVINTVERVLINRLIGSLGWNSPFGLWIKERNRLAADSCVYYEAESGSVQFRGVFARGEMMMTDDDPQINITLPKYNGHLCIRIAFSSNSQTDSRLYLPRRDGRILASRSLSFNGMGGERLVQIVLGDEYSEKTVRFDPISEQNEIANVKIWLGK